MRALFSNATFLVIEKAVGSHFPLIATVMERVQRFLVGRLNLPLGNLDIDP